jgi:hypothetical protein
MTKTTDDMGRARFKEIGRLSSLWPSYVRHCCRALHDGTDREVLEENRLTALYVLDKYSSKYAFAKKHFDLMNRFYPSDIWDIIRDNKGERNEALTPCYATMHNVGLPKRSCLHCPKVAHWMKVTNEVLENERLRENKREKQKST